MYQRNLGPAVLAALQDTPVVLLHGARQVGKTTLAHMLIEQGLHAHYLTLDTAATLSAARSDPEGFVQGLSTPCVLDEVQRVPELLLAIKARVDSQRKPGSFLLAGSASVFMLPQLADALVGRMEVLTLWPLSQGEIEGRRESFLDALLSPDNSSWFDHVHHAPLEERQHLISRVVRGGFPAVVTREDPSRRQAWLESYLTTVVQREVRDVADVHRLTEFPQLLRLLAARLGSLANFAELARSSGIPQSTIKRYLTLLTSLFLVYLLPSYATNLSKRVTKSPKLYLTDSGAATFLMGVDEARLLAEPMLLGPLLEGFVVMELVKQLGWSSARCALYHFRTVAGAEVDVVVEARDGRVAGVEVKAAASLGARDFAGLRILAEAAGEKFVRGVVLYLGNDVVPISRGLWAVPLAALWS